jgi:hypothetical protein
MLAVFADLLQAVDRMDRTIGNQDVQKWFNGYRDGLIAAQERFRITQSKCCCQRINCESPAASDKGE